MQWRVLGHRPGHAPSQWSTCLSCGTAKQLQQAPSDRGSHMLCLIQFRQATGGTYLVVGAAAAAAAAAVTAGAAAAAAAEGGPP
jgi:hypothetical protein